MRITNRQLKVIVGILVITLAMSLFPPWKTVYKRKSVYGERPIGYRFIFSPPAPEEYKTILVGRNSDLELIEFIPDDQPKTRLRDGYSVKIDFERLAIQFLITILFAVSLILVGHSFKDRSISRGKDKENARPKNPVPPGLEDLENSISEYLDELNKGKGR